MKTHQAGLKVPAIWLHFFCVRPKQEWGAGAPIFSENRFGSSLGKEGNGPRVCLGKKNAKGKMERAGPSLRKTPKKSLGFEAGARPKGPIPCRHRPKKKPFSRGGEGKGVILRGELFPQTEKGPPPPFTGPVPEWAAGKGFGQEKRFISSGPEKGEPFSSKRRPSWTKVFKKAKFF